MLTANIFYRNTHVHGYCILDTIEKYSFTCLVPSMHSKKNTYSHPTAINTLYRNTYFTGPLPISCYMYTHSKPSAVLHSADAYFHANCCATPCRNTHSHVHCSCTLEKHTFTCPLLSCTLQKHLYMPTPIQRCTETHTHMLKAIIALYK